IDDEQARMPVLDLAADHGENLPGRPVLQSGIVYEVDARREQFAIPAGRQDGGAGGFPGTLVREVGTNYRGVRRHPQHALGYRRGPFLAAALGVSYTPVARRGLHASSRLQAGLRYTWPDPASCSASSQSERHLAAGSSLWQRD